MRAAETLRREGYAGALTLLGAEPHWPPYDRPPLSKQLLTGVWDVERTRLRVEDFEVELRLNCTATALTPEAVIVDGDEEVPYDGLVIATGAAPRLLVDLTPGDGVHVLRTIDDALGLKRDLERASAVTVVGAGFIGCEVAASCRTLGLDVALVEALPLPLVRVLGADVGEFCAALHRRHGVSLHLGAGVAGADGTTITLSDGTVLRAGAVVVGVGVAPRTSWLEGAGLTLDNGVVCDATLAAVNTDNVVAAGDVARWPNLRFGDGLVRIEHWTNAVEQAEHAARRLLHGASAGTFEPIPYFWSDQYETKFQFVGTGSPDDEVVIAEGALDAERFVAAYRREGRTVGALCVNAAARTIPWRAHIAGEGPWPTA